MIKYYRYQYNDYGINYHFDITYERDNRTGRIEIISIIDCVGCNLTGRQFKEHEDGIYDAIDEQEADNWNGE